jgi:hypothetical protein
VREKEHFTIPKQTLSWLAGKLAIALLLGDSILPKFVLGVIEVDDGVQMDMVLLCPKCESSSLNPYFRLVLFSAPIFVPSET